MTRWLRATFLSAACAFCLSANAFENLDFEHASPVVVGDPRDYQFQTVEDVLPGWTVEGNEFAGSTFLYYNSAGHIGLAPTIFSIIDGFNGNEGSHFFPATSGGTPLRPLQGSYSLFVDTRAVTGSISQMGDVPTDAKSVRFLRAAADGAGLEEPPWPFELFLGGGRLDVIELSSVTILAPIWADGAESTLPPDFCSSFPQLCHPTPIGYTPIEATWYGANIPAHLAGANTELEFSFGTNRTAYLDDIQFSPIPIPEPTSFITVMICVGVAVVYRQRRS